MRPLVLVLLGTDHHPFDRLVAWSDEVADLRPDLRILVQHGASRAPRAAEGRAYLSHRELTELVATAAADGVVRLFPVELPPLIAEACARALKRAGAAEVHALALARVVKASQAPI